MSVWQPLTFRLEQTAGCTGVTATPEDRAEHQPPSHAWLSSENPGKQYSTESSQHDPLGARLVLSTTLDSIQVKLSGKSCQIWHKIGKDLPKLSLPFSLPVNSCCFVWYRMLSKNRSFMVEVEEG